MIAPDKFKGSLSAAEAASAIARGLRGVPGLEGEIVCIPMADGGEGTVDAFVAQGATRHTTRVRGPLGTIVTAPFAMTADGVAVIEIAAASGLLLIEDEARDIMRASSYGTGELLRAALDLSPERIVVGIGGSATNDGGAGMLQALGVRFLDEDGTELGLGATALAKLTSVDGSRIDSRIASAIIDVACDVDNPLLGPVGATYAYGPQKGAAEDQLPALELGLTALAEATAASGRPDVRNCAGAGAAGGLGFALLAYLGARIRAGVDVVAEACGLDSALRGAQLCLTGEGRIDAQTLRGKTVAGVARRAAANGVPIIAFAGAIDASIEPALFAGEGATAFPIVDRPMRLTDAIANAAPLLEAAAARVGRLLVRLDPDSTRHGAR